jgi:hypothetical protein
MAMKRSIRPVADPDPFAHHDRHELVVDAWALREELIARLARNAEQREVLTAALRQLNANFHGEIIGFVISTPPKEHKQ